MSIAQLLSSVLLLLHLLSELHKILERLIELFRLLHSFCKHVAYIDVKALRAKEEVHLIWQRWTSGLTRRRNYIGKTKSMNASTGQRHMFIRREPEAVARVGHVIPGDDRPLSRVGSTRGLAVPGLRMRAERIGTGKSVGVEQYS